VLLLVLSAFPAQSADEPAAGTVAEPNAELKQLGDEVDMLQLVTDLGLSKEQVTQLAAKVAQINAKRKEYAKREQDTLLQIKSSLEQMKDALINGKPMPDAARILADSGLKGLEALRKQGWADYDIYIASAAKVLTAKQIRDVRRSPEARKRAGEMVQDIRFCSPEKYPQVREKLVNELVEVKKIDKQEEWLRIGTEKLAGLTGEARNEAIKDLQKIKDTDIAQMKTELSQLIDSIQAADSRVLSVGVDRLASALRSDMEVNAEIKSMMSRILDSPTAESVLKTRAQHMKETTAESDQ
jgi:small-conductance mechanosensitive channel